MGTYMIRRLPAGARALRGLDVFSRSDLELAVESETHGSQ